MNSKEIGKPLLLGRCFTQKSFNEAAKYLGSEKGKDLIAQGYQPGTSHSDNGVLYSWKDRPLAYWDVPTLNSMIFSKALWEGLLQNPFIQASLDSKSMWGEAFHADSDEILIPNVALRVNNFRCIDSNLVVGDVDLMDTPNGLICYALAQSGRIGNSSRGFGNLGKPNMKGLRDVIASDYQHVGWDAVTFPAVPECTMTVAEESASAIQDMGTLGSHLRELIGQAYERAPNNPHIKELYYILSGRENEIKDLHRQNMFSRQEVLSMIHPTLPVLSARKVKNLIAR